MAQCTKSPSPPPLREVALTRRSAFLALGLVLLLVSSAGWIVGEPGWGGSWIGLGCGVVLVLVGLTDDGGRPPRERAG